MTEDLTSTPHTVWVIRDETTGVTMGWDVGAGWLLGWTEDSGPLRTRAHSPRRAPRAQRTRHTPHGEMLTRARDPWAVFTVLYLSTAPKHKGSFLKIKGVRYHRNNLSGFIRKAHQRQASFKAARRGVTII